MTINQEEIKKEAKQIMDNFMEALGDIEVEKDFNLEREKSLREETNSSQFNEDFGQRFLANAPQTSGNAIQTKKGEWTK